MPFPRSAAEAYDLFKRGKQIRSYARLAKDLVDENTRPGGLMNLGIDVAMNIAGRALGTSLSSHPYFAYHKTHLTLLAQALNTSSIHDNAMEALAAAIRSADGAAALTRTLTDYSQRRSILRLSYMVLSGSVSLLQEQGVNPDAVRVMREAGQTPESLRAFVDEGILAWRMKWCQLYLESVQLLAMAQVELRLAEAAMRRYDEKMKALAKNGSLGTIAALSAEQDRQWQQFDRMRTPAIGNARAVADPVGFARDQVSRIEQVSDRLGENCEVVMGDDAYNVAVLNARLGS